MDKSTRPTRTAEYYSVLKNEPSGRERSLRTIPHVSLRERNRSERTHAVWLPLDDTVDEAELSSQCKHPWPPEEGWGRGRQVERRDAQGSEGTLHGVTGSAKVFACSLP